MFSFLKKKIKNKKNPTVSDSVRDYSKEEFFVKKAEAAKKIIEIFGYPKSLSIKK